MSSDEELNYVDSYYLPTLYMLDKRGKERVWRIWVEDCTVKRIQGLVDGKKQNYSRDYEGKNIGRKNETTPFGQASGVAETTWAKQIDKGYLPKCKEGKAMVASLNQENSKSGGHNSNARATLSGGEKKKTSSKKQKLIVKEVKTPIKPMKASVWSLKDPEDPLTVLPRVTKYFDFDEGVYIQTKIDGWRCIARQQIEDGQKRIVLTTNNKKQYPWFANLRKEIAEFIEGKNYLDGLDGEIYTHRLLDENNNGLTDEARFSAISSMSGIARSAPHPLEDQICFIVFDLVDLSGTLNQDQRFKVLKKLFADKKESTKHIQRCVTKIANFTEEIQSYQDQFSQEGYEGVIVRARDLLYTDKRSLKMRKYKYFIDREYPIVDVQKDQGVDDEYFVWVCEDEKIRDNSGSPIRFRAKPMGCREDRRNWYRNFCEYLGLQLTVKFQEYSEDGIPRFPVAVGIREDQ